MKHKITPGKIESILVGGGLGFIIALYLHILLNASIYVIFSVPVILFATLGWRRPIFTEYLAYAISVFVILQAGWDLAVDIQTKERLTLLISAVGLLVLNIFTGRVKLIGAKNTFKRSIGLK